MEYPVLRSDDDRVRKFVETLNIAYQYNGDYYQYVVDRLREYAGLAQLTEGVCRAAQPRREYAGLAQPMTGVCRAWGCCKGIPFH